MTVQEWLGSDNQIGIDIWEKKYRWNNEDFDSWLNRVSGNDEDVRKLIVEKKFLFGGRILASRGISDHGRKVTYSNCYVIEPPSDNIESIFECASKLARTYSYGGGCGISISKLAPCGAKVNNAAKESSGAVSFMDLYSKVTESIGQGGRRGAMMISLSSEHPDLEAFIDAKKDLSKINHANISIQMSDNFMKAALNNEKHKLFFERSETGEIIEKQVDAKNLLHKIAKNNWEMGEPGMLFWDRIEDYNLLSNDDEFEYAGVNPCAEEPLPSGGSCLLGSINLSSFVNNGKFDFSDFEKTVEISVRALNNTLDEGLPLHPLQEQRDSVRDWRQIGLGIMGLADCLIKMNIAYGSKESLSICDKIALSMAKTAIKESARLAHISGKYPKCNNIYNIISTDFFKNNSDKDIINLVKDFGLRNSQLLTCAPTGSISTMIGVSGGIEPIYANYYIRTTKSLHNKDVSYKIYTPIVKQYIDENNLSDETNLPDYFVTAQNLNYNKRIAMQSVWQKHIDASISSTINLPFETTIEDVENIYIEAWKSKLKGITIFRDGCSRAGILTTDKDNSDNHGIAEIPRGYILDINDDLIGKKRKLTGGCGSIHVNAYFDPDTGDLMETWLNKGSKGGCNNFMIGLSRMISLAARGGIDIEAIVDQLDSAGTCASYAVRRATKFDTSKGSCCPVAIGNALLEMWNEVKKEISADEDRVDDLPIKPVKNPCPQCGSELIFEGGCNACRACGWSKCS